MLKSKSEKPQEVKQYHKVGNTNAEWVEFKKQTTIQKAKDDCFMLTFTNVLREQPQLVQELKELYGNDVEHIEEMWVRLEVIRENNVIIHSRTSVQKCTPPIIAGEFTHTLTFFGTDFNYLKFIEWDALKKLEEREKLKNIDVSTPKEPVEKVNNSNDNPTTILTSSIYDTHSKKDSIELPPFMNNRENRRRVNFNENADWNKKVSNFEKAIDKMISDINNLFKNDFGL